MKKLLATGVLLVVALVAGITSVHAKTDPNTKLFVGKYNVVSSLLSGSSLYYSGPSMIQQIAVSKSGAITGSWTREDSRDVFNPVTTPVSIKGSITKIKKKGKKFIATISFAGSDGMKSTGSIEYYKISIVKTYSITGKTSLSLDGSMYKGTFVGARAP